MSFEWTDRDRRQHLLTSPAPIVAEADEIARQIDRLIPSMESADVRVRDAARLAIAPLTATLERRHADLDRWNAHADQLTQAAAVELVEQIDTLPETIASVMLVVALHDEHDRLLAITNAAPQTRAAMLADRMTPTQRRAFMAVDVRLPSPDTMTRGEGKSLLDAEPRFARERADTGGWFAWTDRDDHAHRTLDPLPIEREMAIIAGELAAMRPELGQYAPPDAMFTTVEAAATRWQRLVILKGDLDRFAREAQARDLEDCKRFAVDWRSKRKMT